VNQIYAVHRVWEYEGSELLGVATTRDSAKAIAEAHLSKKDRREVEAWRPDVPIVGHETAYIGGGYEWLALEPVDHFTIHA
jgi:hypothetical protein